MGRYISLLIIILLINHSNATRIITKRSLIFPQYTVLQFTYGVTAPLILPKRSLNLSVCVQINYEPPFNSSQILHPNIVIAKSSESESYDLDRQTFYNYIIDSLNGFSLDGKECLLRSICEIAEIPMHIDESDNLLENIVHYLFTPSEDYYWLSKNDINAGNNSINDEFLNAEIYGRKYGKCYEYFLNCPVSLPDLFTKLFYF